MTKEYSPKQLEKLIQEHEDKLKEIKKTKKGDGQAIFQKLTYLKALLYKLTNEKMS